MPVARRPTTRHAQADQQLAAEVEHELELMLAEGGGKRPAPYRPTTAPRLGVARTLDRPALDAELEAMLADVDTPKRKPKKKKRK